MSFPSQIEGGADAGAGSSRPHYVLEVQRPERLDELEVLVEMRPESPADERG